MRLSRVLKVLEDAWEEIQRTYPGVPDVLILVSDTDEMGQAEPGQVVIATNALRTGAAYTIDTLLHEAVHQHLIARGEKKKVWHSHGKKFRTVANDFGMVTFGQSNTIMLASDTIHHFSKYIEKLSRELGDFVLY